MYKSALGDFANEQAERVYIETLRHMTPEQKWQAAFELWQMSVDTARARVRADHPDWAEERVRAEIARRIMELNGATRIPVSRH